MINKTVTRDVAATRKHLRDFRLEDHPISRVGTHLMWDAGGAVGDDDYSALDLAASFLALTPR